MNSAADQLISLDDFRNDPRFLHIQGSGLAAVVIDTGIDLNHSFFGPDVDSDGVSDRITYQYDFADDDSDASDKDGHGSHVASIIISSDDTHRGVAPAADLIALKVFEDSGAGEFDYLESSLQWVINNAAAYNIATVNLSLGDEKNWASESGRYDVGDELAALYSMGIIVTAAAGNNFSLFNSQPGLAYPAIDPNVISVGALRSSTGQVADFSQRHASLLDIFAPGVSIVGANARGGTKVLSGTSQAAGYLSGVAVLAQQVATENLGRRLTAQEFDTLLLNTSTIINDGDDEIDAVVNTGQDFLRLDVLSLAEGILALNETVESQAQPDLTSLSFNAVSDHVLLGQTDINFTIANIGSAASLGFDVDVVYSDDDTIGNEDDIVVSTLSFSAVESGETVDYSGAVQLPIGVLNSRAQRDNLTGLEVNYISDSYDSIGIVIDPEAFTDKEPKSNNYNQGKGIDKDDITYFPWDINNDGSISPTDAIFVVNRLGQGQSTPLIDPLADFDGDGFITPSDAIAAINRLGYSINSSVFE